MKEKNVRDTLLAMENKFLRNQILTQLCRWERYRDDRDLIKALSSVHELVAIEDNDVTLGPQIAQA